MILKIMKWFFGVLGSVVLLVIGVALLAWCFPEKILTSERVSEFVAPHLHVERPANDPFPNAPLVSLEIRKSGFWRRSFEVRLAPGCYSLVATPKGGTEACIENADIGISMRVSRKHLVRLTGLDRINLHVTRGRFVTEKSASKPEVEKTTNTGLGFLKYLDRGFRWGPIAIVVDEFELPAAGLHAKTKISSAETDYRGKDRSPKLAIDVSAISPDWRAGIVGEVFQADESVVVPSAKLNYRTKSKNGGESITLTGELAAKYGLDSGNLDATFSVLWKDPTPDIEALRAEKGSLKMRAEEVSAATTLKVVLKGKTPLGRLPVVSIDVRAAMHPLNSDGKHPIDFDLGIESYEFAGARMKSDLAISLIPEAGGNELRWRKGAVEIAIADFANTVRILARTPWAIPTPFNVFKGPAVLLTEPFRAADDRTTIPVKFTTNFTSAEQAFVTETGGEIDVGKNGLRLLAIRVAAVLKKVQIRLPDYEPLAPTPALARDSRIVRYKAPKPSKIPESAKPRTEKSMAFSFSVKGDPGSIILLNRYFFPSLTAGIHFATNPDEGSLSGSVNLSQSFGLHYLNREISVDKIDIVLHPAVEVTAVISMERSGYHIQADLHQIAGKTKIILHSTPPLQDNEIVSLLIYGMPMNSISSEQSSSVGSTQAAISSEALGIFSFFAFASTPIQTVLYDPATQTYSAVVRLPGGVTASIGSGWDNARQVALSKSLGRNFALSTELIKDSNGVDQAGTLLRWRKSY
jgi:hypothetical protein